MVERTSPSIVDVIQEIISRPGWSSGNALELILIRQSGAMGFMAYDASSSFAATLEITCSTASSSISPSVSPSLSPSASTSPSESSSASPSLSPSISPSLSPSLSPSISPSLSPSEETLTSTTWNSSDKGSRLSLSGSDLIVTHDNTDWFNGIRSVLGVSSGKWYWEYTMTTADSSHYAIVGVGNSSQAVTDGATSTTNHVGNSTNSWGYYATDGDKIYNDSETAYGTSFTTGNVIGVALDMDTGKVWFSKNGTWQNSGNPAAGTGEAFSSISGTIYAMVSIYYHNDVITANFGGSAFSYSAPSGFTSGLGE
jgi:hypothetical protein